MPRLRGPRAGSAMPTAVSCVRPENPSPRTNAWLGSSFAPPSVRFGFTWSMAAENPSRTMSLYPLTTPPLRQGSHRAPAACLRRISKALKMIDCGELHLTELHPGSAPAIVGEEPSLAHLEAPGTATASARGRPRTWVMLGRRASLSHPSRGKRGRRACVSPISR